MSELKYIKVHNQRNNCFLKNGRLVKFIGGILNFSATRFARRKNS